MDTFGKTFTPEKLAAFKKELAKHNNHDDVFEFDGKQWLVAYARYLSEFLTGHFLACEMTGRKSEYKGTD